ncbi:MAG TPA: histidine phosphotransferase family protein [Thermohalobaculum sp.]|nr:histidine phosphotransferase family protein [Thermohalobaculum sp.]
MPNDVATGDADDEGAVGPDLRLAELVAARLCHDLVNPVGAIGNGIELMREIGAGDGEDLDLIASSTARTAALLGLHRLAFGPQPPDAAPLPRARLAERLEPLFAGGRAAWRIEEPDGPALPAPVARLAALMGLAGRALAGRTGEVVLSLPPDGGLPIALAVSGSGIAWPPEREALVLGQGTARSSRQIEFAMLPRAARAAGAVLRPTAGPDRVGLEATAA